MFFFKITRRKSPVNIAVMIEVSIRMLIERIVIYLVR